MRSLVSESGRAAAFDPPALGAAERAPDGAEFHQSQRRLSAGAAQDLAQTSGRDPADLPNRNNSGSRPGPIAAPASFCRTAEAPIRRQCGCAEGLDARVAYPTRVQSYL